MTTKLAMLVFDAAELSLVERGIDEGWLPSLRRLRARGVFTRLRSTSDILVGSVWPTFYRNTLPPEHGMFAVQQWRPEVMVHQRPDASWIPNTPFYRELGAGGPRVLAIDMPFAPPPTPFDGVELVSWNAHASMKTTASYPADLCARVRREFGPPIFRDEIYGPQSASHLLRLRDRMIRATEQQADLICALAEREPWDLLTACLAAGHRAGHKLWDATGVRGSPTHAERVEIDDALRRVYIACDAAIGRIEAAVGPSTKLIVFTLNGMTATTSHYFLLPEMLGRVLDHDESDRSAETPRNSLPQRLRDKVPLELRSAVKERLPLAARDALGRYWRQADRRDWSRTRALRLIGSDLEGQVQINLRGREHAGIVEPGAEYEALCAEIADGLASFVDADTGEPLIAEVLRLDRRWPEVTERRVLPDLVVRWAVRSPIGLRTVRSPRFGAFVNPHHGTLPDGRSGHHQPSGWAIATGPGVQPGETPGERPVFDLTATVYAHFGITAPDGARGKPIAEFTGRHPSYRGATT